MRKMKDIAQKLHIPNLFPPQGWKRRFPEILIKPISTPGVETTVPRGGNDGFLK